MNNASYHHPTVYHFGTGMEALVGQEVRKYSESVLLHYGQGSINHNGLYERVKQSLNEAKLNIHELGGVEPNPKAALVHQGIEICRRHDIRFVLAVGGGSVVDSAKAISVGVPYSGDFFDFFDGAAIPNTALGIGIILTIPGAGSESSPASVITLDKRKYVCDTPLLIPTFAILNPMLTKSVPQFETTCGIVDAMTHLFERYFTNTNDVDCTDRICEGLLLTLIDSAVRVRAEPENYGVRANIMWACKLAHDPTPGFGRKQDWGCHKIGHEIGALSDASHGAIMGVIFLAWFKWIAQRHDFKLRQLGQRVFGIEAHPMSGLATIAAFECFLSSIGMPTSLRELGMDIRQAFQNIATHATQRMSSGTIGNYVRLSPDDIVALLEIAH